MGEEKPRMTPAQVEREKGNKCYKAKDFQVQAVVNRHQEEDDDRG